MKILTIFTSEVKTCKFNNVKNIRRVNKDLHFNYIGKSSGKITKAIFWNIAGYVVTDENGDN